MKEFFNHFGLFEKAQRIEKTVFLLDRFRARFLLIYPVNLNQDPKLWHLTGKPAEQLTKKKMP